MPMLMYVNYTDILYLLKAVGSRNS